jgi:hypothetical protein
MFFFSYLTDLQAQPKMLKKIVETTNLPIKTKIFPKEVCLVISIDCGERASTQTIPKNPKNIQNS